MQFFLPFFILFYFLIWVAGSSFGLSAQGGVNLRLFGALFFKHLFKPWVPPNGAVPGSNSPSHRWCRGAHAYVHQTDHRGPEWPRPACALIPAWFTICRAVGRDIAIVQSLNMSTGVGVLRRPLCPHCTAATI